MLWQSGIRTLRSPKDMISIVIPTLNANAVLAPTLASLVPALASGVLRDVVLVDGGSSDETVEIAEAAGLTIVPSERGRGTQLRAGVETAKGDWLLFLHADTVLEAGWDEEVRTFVERIKQRKRPDTAAAFRFVLDDVGFMPRLVEWGVAWRCTLLGMPYGDQGLLISRRLYNKVGGYKDMPLLEDVDLIRRLGRSRILILKAGAMTSAVRYQRGGYVGRVLRNWCCMLLYYCGVPIRHIVRIYN